jgi:nitrogen fixation/metabolism regulation signal transduction histidine kinase
MRHLTAPLVRLRQALPRIRDGNLSITTRLCREDYLTVETELLNQMTAQLTARLSACKQAQAALTLDYDRLKQFLATTRELDVAKLTRPVDQDLADLRSTLDWFKTHKG